MKCGRAGRACCCSTLQASPTPRAPKSCAGRTTHKRNHRVHDRFPGQKRRSPSTVSADFGEIVAEPGGGAVRLHHRGRDAPQVKGRPSSCATRGWGKTSWGKRSWGKG
eukprot:1344859-Rhodomonas_salina.1